MPRYSPPVLNCRVTVRNPASKPVDVVDRYGRAINAQTWGHEVFAARRDVGTRTKTKRAPRSSLSQRFGQSEIARAWRRMCRWWMGSVTCFRA